MSLKKAPLFTVIVHGSGIRQSAFTGRGGRKAGRKSQVVSSSMGMNNSFDILSYLSKSSVSALLPDTGQPMSTLLSADTPDAFEAAIRKGIKEMDSYNASHPLDGTLPPEERSRYETNREFVKKTAKLNIFRNLILLEIWERGQWRFEFQDITDFARQVADLSKAQLYKCIDDAKVLRFFAREETSCVAPQGRMVEEICKVPEEHRIEAWQYAHEVTKEAGLSQDSARVALRDYCRDHQLRYGRRATNPSSLKKDATVPVDVAAVEIACQDPEAAIQEEEPVGEAQPLDAREEEILTRAVTPAILRRVEKCFPTKRPHEVVLYNIRSNYPEARVTPEEQRHVSELLGLLASLHPEVAEKMMLHGLKHVKATIEATVVKYCKKNTSSKMAYKNRRNKSYSHQTSETAEIAVKISYEKQRTESANEENRQE